MVEPLILFTLTIIPLLYSIGGLIWKPIRRYCVPMALACISLYNNSFGIREAISVALLCLGLHLGYGENKSWFKRVIYSLSISLPSIIIKFTPWCLVIPIVFLGTFYLSNNPKTAKLFNWRISEYLTGLSIAITYSQIL